MRRSLARFGSPRHVLGAEHDSDYGFSPRFAWFNDELGLSWQVNIEA